MPEQAHVGSEISHSNALNNLIKGVIIGAAAGVVLGALTVSTGGAALALAVASGAATGASLGGTIGKIVGSKKMSPAGRILEGSPNVRVNGKPAAFCRAKAACDKHPGAGAALAATGSGTVFVNRNPAARVGDLGTCGFTITGGSPNVFVGGPQAGCGLAITPEVPPWVDRTLQVLGVVGAVTGFGAAALALRATGMAGAQIAARLGASALGGKVGGDVAGALGGRYFGEGSLGQLACQVGGSVLGGGAGYRGGAALDARPRLNPFNYRPAPRGGATLYSGVPVPPGGFRYAGPATTGTRLTSPPRGPGLEARGYRPQPGERGTTREHWRAAESRRRADATTNRIDRPLEQPNPKRAQHGHGHADHGHQTTAQQQGNRVRTGITPSGRVANPPPRASSYSSPQAEAEAIGRGRRALDADLRAGRVDTHPDPRTGQPTYIRPDGSPVRHDVSVQTNRPGGFGRTVVKERDPVTGQILKDASGLPRTVQDPTPRVRATVVWEYVPSTGEWRAVTSYPGFP